MARTVPLMVCVGFLVGLLPAARCYSSGSVSAACGSMVPGHAATPQNGPSPFTVTSNATTYQQGDQITVRLQSTDSTTFKGFMLQAREVGSEVALGSFVVLSGPARLLTCNDVADSAVAHNSPVEKTVILATWTAAVSQDPKPIKFHATFVQEYATFWVKVESLLLSHSPAVLTSTVGTS